MRNFDHGETRLALVEQILDEAAHGYEDRTFVSADKFQFTAERLELRSEKLRFVAKDILDLPTVGFHPMFKDIGDIAAFSFGAGGCCAELVDQSVFAMEITQWRFDPSRDVEPDQNHAGMGFVSSLVNDVNIIHPRFGPIPNRTPEGEARNVPILRGYCFY